MHKNAKQNKTEDRKNKIGLVSQKYYTNKKSIAHLSSNENHFRGY